MLSELIGNLTYNIDVEIAFLLIAVIIFILMLGTLPRRTDSYAYDFFGMLFSIFSSASMILTVWFASNVDVYGLVIVKILMLVHIYTFSIVLFNMAMYMCALSYRNKGGIKKYRRICLVFVLLMDVYCTAAVIMGYMMNHYGQNPFADISEFIIKMVHCGMICSAACLLLALSLTKDMPKVVRIIIFTVYPLNVIFLLIQKYNTRSLFIAMTYVVPLTFFYILFHSNPYDEILGLQNTYSLESRFEDNIILKKPFYIGYLIIPSFNKTDAYGAVLQDGKAFDTIASYCRMAESKYSNMHIYKQSIGTFTFIYEGNASEDNNRKLHELADIAEEKLREVDELAKIIMVVLPCFEEIRTISMAREMVNLIIKNNVNPLENYRYVATKEDNRKFQERYRIEQELADIRLERNMDDERVVCYAQPIYEVESGSFRTAEALMRLKLDGEMVSPGLFIPVAEENDCIHSLTLIMLDKVCKELKILEKDYEFTCISVNCSAKEFSMPNLADEVLEIIRKYDVDPSKIRLELTESAVVDDNNNLRKNMYNMREKGISFYLDDFGTGYSAMSRVIDLPFKTIKFDKSLLYQSIDDDRMDTIISNMIETLKRSGINTLVEGVESPDQNEYSISHGFDFIQGFHYAKPVPISELRNYFERKK